MRAQHLSAIGLCLLIQPGVARAQTDTDSRDPPSENRRIIKQFDFVEPDNHELVPMYWRRFEAPGFPQFAKGQFDFDQGHGSPPAFRLASDGGNIGYYYYHRAIPTQPGNDYQIRAWVKPHQLESARAYVSAFFMDRFGRKIEGTEHISEPIGGPDANDEWQPVRFILPGDHPDAHLISVALFVLQDQPSKPDLSGSSPIHLVDIQAGAWFDDVAVWRLPRIQLACEKPGAVFEHGDTPSVLALVSDSDGSQVRATVVLTDTTNQERSRQQVPIQRPGPHDPSTLAFPDLEPGTYSATLKVEDGGVQVQAPRVTFAKLGRNLASGALPKRGFGLRLTRVPDELWPDVARLTDLLGIWDVKIPIWEEGRPAIDPPGTETGLSVFLSHIYRKNGRTVGILAGVPKEMQNPNSTIRKSLFEILAEPANNWSAFLKYGLARYASFVDSWQLGSDDTGGAQGEVRLGALLGSLSQSLGEVISAPQMVAPWNVHRILSGGNLSASALSLRIPTAIQPEQFQAHFDSFQTQPFPQRWASVDTLDGDSYERTAFLADYARRLIAAKASTANVVFVDPPWSVETVLGRQVIAPRETFLILRTLISLLSNTEVMVELDLGGGTRGYLFDRDGTGVMALWNRSAPPGGLESSAHLGGEPRSVSIWGEVSEIARSGGKHVLHVSQTPILIEGVSTRLVMLRNAVRLDPPHLESSLTMHELDLVVSNPYRESITGRIRLEVPRSWDVSPLRTQFSINPGGNFRETLSIRFPQTEIAGKKVLSARMVLDSDREYELEIPLEIDLRIHNLGVSAIAQRHGEDVLIRHQITNYSESPVNYRGYVVAPGRPRQTRLIHNLRPGQSVIKEYKFSHSADLTGRRVRVGLRELDGTKTHNQEIEVP